MLGDQHLRFVMKIQAYMPMTQEGPKVLTHASNHEVFASPVTVLSLKIDLSLGLGSQLRWV